MGTGKIKNPCSADDEQDRQPYAVDPYFVVCDGYTCIQTELSCPWPQDIAVQSLCNAFNMLPSQAAKSRIRREAPVKMQIRDILRSLRR